MNILKLSVFVRQAELVWSYKKEKGSDFWEDLRAALGTRIDMDLAVHCPAGNSQHHFYIAANAAADYYKRIAGDILGGILPDPEQKRFIIVSVTEVKPEELEKLRESTEAENSAFWRVVDKVSEKSGAASSSSPADAIRAALARKMSGGDEGADTAPIQATSYPENDIPTTSPANKPADAPSPAEDEPITLSGMAAKMKELKEGLLAKVKGQRHAVDELVQSIFECEMFAANNPERKGPLATFLFTGPSGVGKTYLATQCGKLLGRETLVIDMSEYSDNLANGKFNGEHGRSSVVTTFVRKHPDGILIFDEIEKAHINTIHLFLQILDEARLMDMEVKREVSFRDNIIIMTTNAGRDLYEDTTVCDLSATPRSVILEALRSDLNPQTREPFFPECITTRMANGHVILFNHLEPFSLMEIVKGEIALQMRLFEESSGVKVEYDPKMLSAIMLYNGGGVSDARTLRGLARNNIVRELQEIVMQLYAMSPEKVDALKNITVTVDTDGADDIGSLFVSRDRMQVAVFADKSADVRFSAGINYHNTVFETYDDIAEFKRRIRGVADYILIDPAYGLKSSERIPNDIEDLDSDGMAMFRYAREFSPEIPVYVLDTAGKDDKTYDSLLAKGARGIVRLTDDGSDQLEKTLESLSFNALINNAVFSLGRSGKFLYFNCAQYMIDDTCAIVSFEKLQLKSAPRAGDSGLIVKQGESSNVKFADVIGCKTAKETLADFCRALENPRQVALSGKKMPKGILLYGPPGTGKTMLAKAMANECNATFIPVSATSFFSPYVGQTEINIREVFRKARKYAPSIIFIDEVDAIARMRTGSHSSVHNEDALNCLLAEMDGFFNDEKRPVFIIAATNYEIEGDSGRVLDAAFVRRFDRKILIPLPDTDDRFKLLEACLKRHGISFGEEHEKILRNMAERCGGMSNADLEMMNEQFLRAIGDGEPDRNKYMDTLDEFRFGDVNKMDPAELRQTACHEAGHALVCRLCGSTPSFLTVVSRGGFGGYMEDAGKEKGTYSFDEMMNLVCRCLAGRIAEIEIYGESAGMNTGASSDIKKAKYFVRSSLKKYAMGEKFFNNMNYGECERLISKQYNRTAEMIRANRGSLERLTDLLVANKSLDRGQLDDFFTSENI